MKIQNGIIFIWSGTNASIPMGWSRVSDMDDKYPKGTAASTDPNTTGGAATHSHTSPPHTHTNQAHTHTITIASTSVTGTAQGGTGMPSVHSHTCPDSGAVTNFSCDSPSATYAAFSNDPPYSGVIYVTPTTIAHTIPAGIIALADAAAPSGWNICDGTSGTPNLVDKYLKGASAGADGGTTGGSLKNTHALSHTHTTSHEHSAVTSGNPSLADIAVSGSGGVWATVHTHSVALPAPSSNNTTTDNVTLAESAETVEPAYTKLLAIQAAAQALIPRNVIALWKGTLAAIPVGWILCDGDGGTVDMRDRHLKITGTVGSVGTTGGSNTHTHASQSHDHTLTAHSHATTVNHVSAGITVTGSGSSNKGETGHAVTTNSVALVLNSASTTADSSNNEPPYRTVAFIKLVQRIENASLAFGFLT